MKIANFKKINNETTKIKLSRGLGELTVNNNDVTEFEISSGIKRTRLCAETESITNGFYLEIKINKKWEVVGFSEHKDGFENRLKVLGFQGISIYSLQGKK